MNDEVNSNLRFKRIEDDIVELKINDKEMSRDVATIKESHIETKIYMKQIQESQVEMARKNKETQDAMMKGFEDITDKKDKDQAKKERERGQIKIGAWIFAITYVLGCIFGFARMIFPKITG
jgi:hypothetical protein